MDEEGRSSTVASAWGKRLDEVAARLGLRPGEVAELLDRLSLAAVDRGDEGVGGDKGDDRPGTIRPAGRAERRLAQRLLEAYAARKRVVARLARQDRLP